MSVQSKSTDLFHKKGLARSYLVQDDHMMLFGASRPVIRVTCEKDKFQSLILINVMC